MLTAVNKPLGIALLGVNKWERARLELFIDQHWSSNCHLVGEDCADLCILDLDSLDGKKILKQQRDCHPRRPLIAMSIHNTEVNDVSLLRKPLNSNLLKSTIDNHITNLLEVPPLDEIQAAPMPQPVYKNPRKLDFTNTKRQINHRRRFLPNAATQARIIRGSCGPSGTIEIDSQPNNKNLYYDPSGYLQQQLKDAIEQCRREARPLSVHLPDENHISLDPETNIALTNLSDTKLRSRCLLPMDFQQIHIESLNDHEKNRLLNDTETPQDIDSLLWKVTLWCARGRLPLGTDIDSAIALCQWPNLTRLLAIPHFLRIAALWVKSPLPLRKTAEQLNIEARYVCAFFSACCALDLIQTLSMTEYETALGSNQNRSTPPKGLLRRILRHLRLT